MATRDEMQKIAKEVVETYVKSSEGDVTKGRITESELLKELNNNIKSIEKTILGQAKQSIKDSNKRDKLIEKLQSSVLQKLEKQGIIQQAPKQNFFEKIGFRDPTKDDMATQYRARQMAGGIESILSGNFASGLRQIGSTFPKVANFMGGHFYLALTLATRGLLKLDESLTKLNQTTIRSTGGAYSPFMNASFAEKFSYTSTARELLRPYKRQGEYGEILSAIGGNLAPRLYKDTQTALQTVASVGATRTMMEGIGIDKNTSDQLLFKLMKSQGLSSPQAANQLNNLLKIASDEKRRGIYSDPELIKRSSELYDRIKKYNIGIDSAARIIDKFSVSIEKGTVSMEDFASYNRGMYEGETGKLAGIGQLLIEYGQSAGLKVPKELLESSGNPLAVAWNMRRLGELGNKDMLKLMSSWMGTQTENIAGNNEAAAMETLYSLIGPNLGFGKISQPQVQNIVRGGFKNLEDAYALGSKGGPLTGFSDLNDKAKELIDKTTTELSGVTTALGSLKDEIIMALTSGKPIPVVIENQNQLANKGISFSVISTSATMTGLD